MKRMGAKKNEIYPAGTVYACMKRSNHHCDVWNQAQSTNLENIMRNWGVDLNFVGSPPATILNATMQLFVIICKSSSSSRSSRPAVGGYGVFAGKDLKDDDDVGGGCVGGCGTLVDDGWFGSWRSCCCLCWRIGRSHWTSLRLCALCWHILWLHRRISRPHCLGNCWWRRPYWLVLLSLLVQEQLLWWRMWMMIADVMDVNNYLRVTWFTRANSSEKHTLLNTLSRCHVPGFHSRVSVRACAQKKFKHQNAALFWVVRSQTTLDVACAISDRLLIFVRSVLVSSWPAHSHRRPRVCAWRCSEQVYCMAANHLHV